MRHRAGRRLLALAVAAAVVAAGCARDGAPGDDASGAQEGDPGLTHVHGLGVNPADGRVYVATHFGLWRLGEPGEAERVGAVHHDFMGFTVVSDDHFVASGHPPLAEDLPPHLGLIESTDAGASWRSVSLLGEADFHALRAAHGIVYGWNSGDGAFMASTDARQWDQRSVQPSLWDFVVDPDDAQRLLATAGESPEDVALRRSDDGGRTWRPVDGAPMVRLAWSTSDRLWGVGADARVWRSLDAGESWEQTGAAAGVPEAFLDTGEELIVAGGGVIARSADGGRTWEDVYREADADHGP